MSLKVLQDLIAIEYRKRGFDRASADLIEPARKHLH